MHGVILKGLKDHVTDDYGDDAWDAVLDRAEIEPKLYLPVKNYPDEEGQALLTAAAAVAETDRETFLSGVGETLAPALLATFRAHVHDDWDAVDTVANLETIYDLLYEESGESPLTSERAGPDAADLVYDSELELCDVARGVVHGVAAHDDESLDVAESACMHEGDPHCELSVTR